MKVYGMTINDECAIETNAITSFVYAHGKLDREIGYDLLWIPNYFQARDIPEGIHDVDFIYPQGKKVKAKLYIWSDDYGDSHGLCCDITDKDANTDARRKYNRKHCGASGWFV